MKTFRNSSTKRDDAFFFKLKDGPQVHLRGINQLTHTVIMPCFAQPQVAYVFSASQCLLPQASRINSVHIVTKRFGHLREHVMVD